MFVPAPLLASRSGDGEDAGTTMVFPQQVA